MNFEIAPKEYEIKANWYDAKLYCFSLNIDGKTNWRLPSKEELTVIYKSENDFRKTFYWSSIENDGGVLVQDFDNGYQFNGDKDGGGYVRAVRSMP